VNRIPYPVDQSVALMKDFANIILVGAVKPVIFLRIRTSRGRRCRRKPHLHVMTRPEHDQAQALAALADELGNPKAVSPPGEGAAGAGAREDQHRGIRAVIGGDAAGERDCR